MQPKLRFKEFDSDWLESKLGDEFIIRYGKDHKHLDEGPFPVLGSGGVMRRVEKYLYDKPSVLIGRKGTIDKPMYIDKPFWTVDTLFYTEINSNNDPFFIFNLCKRINWKLLNEATGVPSLNTQAINSVKIFKPLLIAEQTKIANFLSAVVVVH